MVDPGLKELMANGLFKADDFEQAWMELDQLVENLRLQDFRDDSEKIGEYKWIVQQLRKYMGTKQDEVLRCDTIDDMVAKVEDLISKQREYGDNRKEVLYNFMRDHWLYGLHSVLSQMAVADRDDEEED